MDDIGVVIRVARQDLGLTAKQISEPLGLTNSYLSQVEHQSIAMDWKYIPALADMLKLPVHVLAEANLRTTKAYQGFNKIVKEFVVPGKTDKVVNAMCGVKWKANNMWQVARFDNLNDAKYFATLCQKNGWKSEVFLSN